MIAACPLPCHGSGMTASTITIRAAQQADVTALAKLKLTTFRETFLDGFKLPYPPADLARFEAETYDPKQIAAELQDSAHATWVAEGADGRLLAYAHAGPCKLPHPDATAAQGEIYQLYALNEAQGLGLGGALMEAALGWLEAEMPGPIWLGVWSGNDRAQAIYARYGFEKIGEYGFAVGDWTDHEFIFRRS